MSLFTHRACRDMDKILSPMHMFVDYQMKSKLTNTHPIAPSKMVATKLFFNNSITAMFLHAEKNTTRVYRYA